MTPITRAPARLSGSVSAGAAILALASSGFYSWVALAVGALGLLLLVGGLVRGANAGVTLGAVGLFAGTVVAGVGGAPPVPVLVGATGAVLSWDAGGTAIGIGRQLGRDADTWRVEAVHAAGSLAVGAATAGVGYGFYRAAAGEQPVAALVFLLLAAVLLVEALG